MVTLTLGLGLTSASDAALTHVREGSFGPDGTSTTAFEQPAALGVDQSTGELYVADAAAGTVRKFGADHEPLAFTGVNPNIAGGALTGFLFATTEPLNELAVNSTSHDFYVVDHGGQSLKAFQSDGEPATFSAGPGSGANEISGFTEVCGVAVDANGDIYVGDYFKGVSIYAPSGEPITTIEVETDCNLAVDSQGDVYLNAFLGPVSKFVPSSFPVTAATSYSSAGVVDEGSVWGVAVNPATEHVLVDEHGDVAEYGQAGERLGAAFGANGPEPLQASEGVAVRGSSGQVYVSDASGSRRVQVFGPAVTLPTVVTGEASNVGPVSATLTGSVNPEEVAITGCRFEYVSNSSFELTDEDPYAAGSAVPCAESPAEIGSGGAPVEVHADTTGLSAGTGYHFRLVASNANGSEMGADATFATPPPPSIEGAEVLNLTATAADLSARINPSGFATSYRFEYGTTTSYGSDVPLPDGSVGGGGTGVVVSQHITGLSPNTTYHWRVVASSANGVVEGSDHIFDYDESGSGKLPDGRAYEMITPPAKNAALIGDVTFGVPPEIAEDGSRVILGADQCFADATSCVGVRVSTGSPYSFSREDGSWVTHALAPPATEFAVNTWQLFNADINTGLFTAPTPPAGEDDFYERNSNDSFVDVGPITPTLNSSQFQRVLVGSKAGTASLSHLVFTSPSPVWPFDPSASGTIYEYSGRGSLTPRLVGVRGGPGSTELVSACATQLGNADNELPYGDLSADGRTVFFTAKHLKSDGTPCPEELSPPPVNELFARVDNSEADARTVAISEPSAGSPATPVDSCTSSSCVENTTNVARFRDAHFVVANADGSRVFFTDTQQLTDDASQDPDAGDSAEGEGCALAGGSGGCNLYLFEDPQQSPLGGHNLIDVSAGAGSGGPRVQGVMASSSDGSHVYFVARGVLTTVAGDQGGVAKAGAENLYVYERDATYPTGHLAFIATLPESDDGEWRQGVGRPANVTPEGRYLVFTSSGALTLDTTRTDGAEQVFRYDAQLDRLTRISIGEHGFNDNGNAGRGNASIVPARNGYTRLGPGRSDPTMSHDGAFIFFMSSVGLTPGALNGVRVGTDGKGRPAYAQNVYEYHEGEVSLISDGRDATAEPSELCEGFSAVCLIGTDATGANVFFATAEQLVSQDTDTQIDFYDARRCTDASPCISPASSSSPPCLGEACHGTPPAASAPPAPGSATFVGAGNVAPSTKPQPQPRPLTRAQKLTRALKLCRSKHSKRRRVKCEKNARRAYGHVKKPVRPKTAGKARHRRGAK